MGEPYWSVGGENDGPGQEDGSLSDGNSPVDQGGDREHNSQEPKQMDQFKELFIIKVLYRSFIQRSTDLYTIQIAVAI